MQKEEIEKNGWNILNPEETASDWLSYQRFIETSSGEFSVAKETYVKAKTGWFSCRSACYLASGRPVITQDTGFSRFIKTGEGLLIFTSPEEAIAAIEDVNRNYRKHCEAAISVAEEYFRFDRVLNRLLELSFA